MAVEVSGSVVAADMNSKGCLRPQVYRRHRGSSTERRWNRTIQAGGCPALPNCWTVSALRRRSESRTWHPVDVVFEDAIGEGELSFERPSSASRAIGRRSDVG